MAVIILQEPQRPSKRSRSRFALFALGFRTFYLLSALTALLLIPLWIAALSGAIPLTPALPLLVWHGHEMIFGFATATIVGFLFTAVRNWTGQRTPTGMALAGLAALWLGARICLVVGPLWLAALLDLTFLPLAMFAIGRALFRARARHNYFILGILAVLWLANVIVYAAQWWWLDVSPTGALDFAIATITVLETIIAGRIIPGFTGNATGVPIERRVDLERATIVFTALALIGWACQVSSLAIGPVAAIATILQIRRCTLWRPLAARRQPMLWILHLSHAWIIVALILITLHALGLRTIGVIAHVLTVGTMAGLCMGMMMRTTLGHTGRRPVAGKIEVVAFVLLTVALLARVLPYLVWHGAYTDGLWIAAAAWCAAFAVFLCRYVPMLVSPRADGLPD